MPKEENPFEADAVAAAWISSVENEKDSFRDRAIYPRLRQWRKRVDGHRFLEIGSGQGICSDKIGLGDQDIYVGVEPSEPLVRRAEELYAHPRRKFQVGGAYRLPTDDASFDGVFSNVVWLHLEDLDQAAREITRVLRPGGSFLINTANPGAYSAWRGIFSAGAVDDGHKIVGPVTIPGNRMEKNIIYFHSLEALLGSFKNAGLEIEHCEAYGRGIDEADADYFIAIQGRKPS